MNRFDYQFPVRVHFGQGCFEESLRKELSPCERPEVERPKYGPTVMLAYGGGSLKRTGLYSRLVAIQCREFAAQYVKDGGDATVIYLPDLDIHGNSHFMFQEKNNGEIADLVADWLEKHNFE